MRTEHRVVYADSRRLSAVASASVHLVVTSPPYPMIAMWDDCFCGHPDVQTALNRGDGPAAFELMHQQLDDVWNELLRVMIPGGIVCINIGDATRSVAGRFVLYPNHSRILNRMVALGFTNLPPILWRKPTNAPNKFMGSGMLPPGAYVTLEHEYIMIFRKGGLRTFSGATEKDQRRHSAYFWEERNRWFSDIWTDLTGTRQDNLSGAGRQRSAAFPFELAYRLISMFSVLGDTILDPFVGTGTTLFAAAAACRNSVGYEVDDAFRPLIEAGWEPAMAHGRRRIGDRLADHTAFMDARRQAGKVVKHINRPYGFPVMTRQETELIIPLPRAADKTAPDRYQVSYDPASAAHPPKPA